MQRIAVKQLTAISKKIQLEEIYKISSRKINSKYNKIQIRIPLKENSKKKKLLQKQYNLYSTEIDKKKTDEEDNTEKYYQHILQLLKKTRLEIDSKNEYLFRRIMDHLYESEQQHKRQPIIHVCGSSGKGSVISKISIGQQATQNWKVGSYMAPHVFNVRERICINNNPINKKDYIRCMSLLLQSLIEFGRKDVIRKYTSNRWKNIIKDNNNDIDDKIILDDIVSKQSYTQINVLASVLHFQLENVDIGILEIELKESIKYDPVDVFKPIVTVVTTNDVQINPNRKQEFHNAVVCGTNISLQNLTKIMIEQKKNYKNIIQNEQNDKVEPILEISTPLFRVLEKRPSHYKYDINDKAPIYVLDSTTIYNIIRVMSQCAQDEHRPQLALPTDDIYIQNKILYTLLPVTISLSTYYGIIPLKCDSNGICKDFFITPDSNVYGWREQIPSSIQNTINNNNYLERTQKKQEEKALKQQYTMFINHEIAIELNDLIPTPQNIIYKNDFEEENVALAAATISYLSQYRQTKEWKMLYHLNDEPTPQGYLKSSIFDYQQYSRFVQYTQRRNVVTLNLLRLLLDCTLPFRYTIYHCIVNINDTIIESKYTSNTNTDDNNETLFSRQRSNTFGIKKNEKYQRCVPIIIDIANTEYSIKRQIAKIAQEFSPTRFIHIIVDTTIDLSILKCLVQNIRTIKSIHCIVDIDIDNTYIYTLEKVLFESNILLHNIIVYEYDGTIKNIPLQYNKDTIHTKSSSSICLYIWKNTKLVLEKVLQLAAKSIPNHGVPSRPTPTYNNVIKSIKLLNALYNEEIELHQNTYDIHESKATISKVYGHKLDESIYQQIYNIDNSTKDVKNILESSDYILSCCSFKYMDDIIKYLGINMDKDVIDDTITTSNSNILNEKNPYTIVPETYQIREKPAYVPHILEIVYPYTNPNPKKMNVLQQVSSTGIIDVGPHSDILRLVIPSAARAHTPYTNSKSRFPHPIVVNMDELPPEIRWKPPLPPSKD